MEVHANQIEPPRDVAPRVLFTVEELVALPEFGYLTKSSLRHLIFNSRTRFSSAGDVLPGNGLIEAGAIIRLGRKVLIDVQKFRQWAMSQREVPALP